MTSRIAELATRLEEEAEQSGSLATWSVASDAWEEAGDATRAWYCFVRSTGRGAGLLTRRSATRLRANIEELPAHRGDAAFGRESGDARGQLQLFDFYANQPRIIVGDAISTNYNGAPDRLWAVHGIGHELGLITEIHGAIGAGGGGRYMPDRIVVRGDNGFDYAGKRHDNEYRLRRRKNPWLRR